jgi:hypothetical protein
MARTRRRPVLRRAKQRLLPTARASLDENPVSTGRANSAAS